MTVSNLTRGDLHGLPSFMWCGLFKKYNIEDPPTFRFNGGMLGDGSAFASFVNDTYNPSNTPPYTEWVEVKFLKKVFPVAVQIESPRGAGAVVCTNYSSYYTSSKQSDSYS